MKCNGDCGGDPTVRFWNRASGEFDVVCSACNGSGWLPFWTPAERAGLKALGVEAFWHRGVYDEAKKEKNDPLERIALARFIATITDIKAYVKAAMRVKGGGK